MKHRNPSWLLLVISLWGIMGIHARSLPDNLDPVKKLIATLTRATQFQLRFTQDNKNETANRIVHGEGTVIYQLPDKFIWTYNTPSHTVMASDGRLLMLIIPDQKQVMIEKALNNPDLSPLSILSDFNELIRNYAVTAIPPDSPGQMHRRWKLLPRDKQSRIRHIILSLPQAKESFLFRLQIFDLAGNRNTLTFQDYQPVSGTFVFRPEIPEGFEVVDFAGQPATDLLKQLEVAR